MSQARNQGFTLIELMVVIAVVAIFAAMAFPSFSDTLRSNYVSTTTNELLASLSLARSEAVRSNANGAICASADGATCGGDWNSGWIVWINTNGNNSVDSAMGERVLRFTQGKPKALLGGTSLLINFDARGRATAGAPISISVRPKDSTSHQRCIRISAAGQSNVKKEACA